MKVLTDLILGALASAGSVAGSSNALPLRIGWETELLVVGSVGAMAGAIVGYTRWQRRKFELVIFVDLVIAIPITLIAYFLYVDWADQVSPSDGYWLSCLNMQESLAFLVLNLGTGFLIETFVATRLGRKLIGNEEGE